MNTAETTTTARRDTPDAVGRGTIGSDSDAPSTLFVLAGSSLGATLIEGEGTPQWFDLREVVALDAIGEAEGSKVRVEMTFDNGGRIEALWPEPFCDKVVLRLRELLDSGSMSTRSDPGSDVPSTSVSERHVPSPQPIDVHTAPIPGEMNAMPAAADAFAQPGPEREASEAAPSGGDQSFVHAPDPGSWLTGVANGSTVTDPSTGHAEPSTEAAAVDAGGRPLVEPFMPAEQHPAGEPPLPGDGPPLESTENESGEQELVLQDVVYHGGHPEHPKKRKNCVLVLGTNGVSVLGPTGPDLQLGWESVRSIEAQNPDEAKFRLNLRAKRDSTTLVIECDEGVTVLVEARHVPTVPLRAALSEIVAGHGVVVA